jgi:preprotein translocase subunit YajC
MTLGAFLGLVNYTWNGMTHNDSIVSGGVTMFILLAIMFAAHSFEIVDIREERKREQMKRTWKNHLRQQQSAQLAN